MRFPKRFLTGLVVMLFTGLAWADFSNADLSTATPGDLANAMAGTGVEYVDGSASYVGSDLAAGLVVLSDEDDVLGIPGGVLLSSGGAADVEGPNEAAAQSLVHELPGDADLDSLISPSFTQDAAVLSFDFIPAGEQVSFQFVFGSETYPYAAFAEDGASLNDVFAAYVNGVNCAILPDEQGMPTGDPVSVVNLNEATNSHLFIDNEFDTAATHHTEMNGFSVVLTCAAAVMPEVVNTVKLAIADGATFDGPEAFPHFGIDSWVLLGSMTSDAPEPPVAECVEDGLKLLSPSGIVSGTVHHVVEPILRGLRGGLANTGVDRVLDPAPEAVHNINCDVVVPLEDKVDPVFGDLTTDLGNDPADLAGLLTGEGSTTFGHLTNNLGDIAEPTVEDTSGAITGEGSSTFDSVTRNLGDVVNPPVEDLPGVLTGEGSEIFEDLTTYLGNLFGL